MSRWTHFRASLSRQSRGRGKDTIAIFVLAVIAITMTLWIFTQQKASLPSWAPVVGEDFAHLTAEFSDAHAVTPGQGQAVVIAGIQVGRISSVELDEGHAVIGMDVQPEYLDVIHPNATLLLRPKTNLNDMTVEIDPGRGEDTVDDGHQFPLSRTEPAIQFEAFLSTLDADTQQYLQLLVAGGAKGIGGRGKQLSRAFRRFQPFAHRIADLNSVIVQRRQALARVIHNFGLLTQELGSRDNQIERFVTSSNEALGNFANQQASIQETLVEFPSTLNALNSALASSDEFSTVARPALTKLIPQAQALGPAFDATGRFFEQTTAPIRDQIRPFTRQVRPVLTRAAEGAEDFDTTVTSFGNSLGAFNKFLNGLAYDPPGRAEPYIFYLSWLNHNLNANFNMTDAGGPLLRGAVLASCNVSRLAYAAAPRQPLIQTILQGARIPGPRELPTLVPTKEEELSGLLGCGPDSPGPIYGSSEEETE